MDLTFTEEDRQFQHEAREWLEDAWPEEMREKQRRSALGKLSKDDLVSWQKKLAEEPNNRTPKTSLSWELMKILSGLLTI